MLGEKRGRTIKMIHLCYFSGLVPLAPCVLQEAGRHRWHRCLSSLHFSHCTGREALGPCLLFALAPLFLPLSILFVRGSPVCADWGLTPKSRSATNCVLWAASAPCGWNVQGLQTGFYFMGPSFSFCRFLNLMRIKALLSVFPSSTCYLLSPHLHPCCTSFGNQGLSS